MKRFVFNQRRVLGLVVVLLLVNSLMMPAWAARWVSRMPRGVLDSLMSHLPLHRLSVMIRPDRPVGADDGLGLADREDLWRQIKKIELELAQARQLIEELTLVRSRLDLKEVRSLPAAVTGVDFNRSHRSLRIGRGRRDAVASGQVVIAGIDLVGRVDKVDLLTAAVNPITTTGTLLEVNIVAGPGDSSQRNYKMQLAYDSVERAFVAEVGVALQDRAREGDLAILADPSWPPLSRGLVVGRVVSVEAVADNPLQQRRLVVRSRRRLPRLSQVIVLIPMP